jgi:ABC-type transport system substrate-binding protein
LPAGISNDEFSKKMIGSGPFAFVQLSKNDNKITEVKMERNKNYYTEKPYLDNFIIKIYVDRSKAENDFSNNKKIEGIFGGVSGGRNFDFKSSKRLGLIFNAQSEKLKDRAVRQKILEGSRFDQPLKLGLTTLDAPLQRDKAEELKKILANQNISVEVFYFNTVKLRDVLSAKNYELLLYGFDFGYDRDPYTFWHSSQIEAQNFAGWTDKTFDILLEDARMITDNQARNAKYDEFFGLLGRESVIKFFEPIIYNYRIKENLKGVEPISGTQPFSRFDNVTKWYMKEKRIRK